MKIIVAPRKIETIILLREHLATLSLKEAKDIVEAQIHIPLDINLYLDLRSTDASIQLNGDEKIEAWHLEKAIEQSQDAILRLVHRIKTARKEAQQ